MPTVLVVEDERDIRDVLRRYLERAGFSVLTTASGAEALRLLDSADLVLLDLGLPDIDGTEILREAHGMQNLPVIVLTARSSTDDRIHGLELGADDYVTKPFSPAEVVLRVQAVLHRYSGLPGEAGPVAYGNGRLRIDEASHKAWLDGALLDLTPTEWGLLAAVAAAPGRAYSRYELVNRVRGYEYAGYERTIDSHIKNLRRKLGASGAEVLETVLGVGYRLALRRDDAS
ncbi:MULTISPECIES: response regulator transcription factor [Cryobacterium]|uniref:Response regulator transcription factor n=1 Tax=Cryobacterium glucosi TaxID=1259175 RepID=A0ABY2IV24_9MICO|nr:MULTISPECIES: response regulator transcription factor [Cryobacterium]MEB0200922.1 response regulator transcription factor [Cryobacterium sp. 5I3]TFB96387.1 response regulator transcription factor [Cryobacterium sp. MDB2-A-1]TFC10475.1 response regulator transcription factor [Cryobacterium sp. MDB2-33-2]TFC12671.1 response regulator transcription factor [Cryobacterium sp. MDB2-A-2]TFC17065.1 response regulator transcription factor [Cryobacterium sp. MDB2-10]